MKSPLHILHLEDDPLDTTLIEATLRAGGIHCATTRVQTREDFLATLERGGVDLILSDFTLPAFDGLSALELVHTRWPQLPVIMVSGTMGEQRAVDSLKNGATDYVLKGQLFRLVPAIYRVMQEVEARAERERLQAQFVEAQKMEVIGQLAAGVAHDFNNILAVIIGYSEVLATGLAPDSPMVKPTEEIRQAAERAAGLTRQLLIFSRKQTVQPIVLDLNYIVKDLDKMLRRLIDEHITMNFLPGKSIGRVLADPGYITQVLMNLVVNARDAMPNGGQLTIATRNVILDAQEAKTHSDVEPGNYVLLSITDTGVGMNAEVKARLFEPFFTTKPKGKGTGLGLTTCLTIVQQSGGCIGITSELGRGTTFNVYFPRVELPVDAVIGSIAAGPMPRGTETLLVVEDEPSVRQLACRVLEAQGYAVLSATNGQDALQVVRKHQGAPVRLVVTDVVMPLMGGRVMAEWLHAIYPDLKIIFTSGYTDDALSLHGVLEPGVAFLSKPYTPVSLTHKVRGMLDGKDDTTFLTKTGGRSEAAPSGITTTVT